MRLNREEKLIEIIEKKNPKYEILKQKAIEIIKFRYPDYPDEQIEKYHTNLIKKKNANGEEKICMNTVQEIILDCFLDKEVD